MLIYVELSKTLLIKKQLPIDSIETLKNIKEFIQKVFINNLLK